MTVTADVRMIVFEPGDGWSYRIFFGRLPGRGLVREYTAFGIAEGSSEPGSWYAFDGPPAHISEETFDRHIQASAMNLRTLWTAWRAWLALTGQADDVHAAGHLHEWRPDWREQLAAPGVGL